MLTSISFEVSQSADRRGENWAFITPTERLTYNALSRVISDIVDVLVSIGVPESTVIATAAPRGMWGAVYGVSVTSRWTSLQLPIGLSDERIEILLRDVDASCVILEQSQVGVLRVALRLGLPLIVLDAGKVIRMCTNSSRIKSGTVDVRAALLIATSGSTGMPKYVPLTHGNVLSAASGIIRWYRLDDKDRCLNLMPSFHVHGLISATIATLVSGGTVICCDGTDVRDTITQINAEHPTWWTGVPAIYESLLAQHESGQAVEPEAAKTVRFFRVSSAPMTQSLRVRLRANQLNAPIVHSYGLTETASLICSLPIATSDEKAESVGLPVNAEIKIVNGAGETNPAGCRGEVLIRGPSVMHSYFLAIGAESEFPFFDGSRWLKTGDEGYFDDDGYLYITGRFKLLIRRGGHSVSPAEIERLVSSHYAVTNCVALGVPHPTLGEDVVCLATLRPTSDIEAIGSIIRRDMFGRLEGYKIPSAIVSVPSIPQNVAGKTDRQEARRWFMRSQEYRMLVSGHAAFDGPIEEVLNEIWLKYLSQKPDIGPNSNLLLVGVDPLRARMAVAYFGERDR